MGTGKITITEQLISDIFGLPDGTEIISIQKSIIDRWPAGNCFEIIVKNNDLPPCEIGEEPINLNPVFETRRCSWFKEWGLPKKEQEQCQG